MRRVEKVERRGEVGLEYRGFLFLGREELEYVWNVLKELFVEGLGRFFGELVCEIGLEE